MNSNDCNDVEGGGAATIMTYRTVSSPPQERLDTVKLSDGRRPITLPQVEGGDVALSDGRISEDPSTPTEGYPKNMPGGRSSAKPLRNLPPCFQGFGNVGRAEVYHVLVPACAEGCLHHGCLFGWKTQGRVIFVDRREEPVNVRQIERDLIPEKGDREYVWCLTTF